MKNPNDGFIRGRLRSVKFAFKGMWILLSTEDSIKAQLFFAFIATIAGFYFQISATEWMIQTLAIGLVLIAEAANTAIEEVLEGKVYSKNETSESTIFTVEDSHISEIEVTPLKFVLRTNPDKWEAYY